jgi:transcriptional regulator with PAS, ATPase and Fis domain
MRLVVQMRNIEAETDAAQAARRHAAWVDAQTDALVVTDSSGRVLMCNPAFTALCNLADGVTAQRRTLAELLGDPAHTLANVVLQARRQGLAHAPQAFLGHASAGANNSRATPASTTTTTLAVDISAMLLAEGDQECIGLRLRRLQPEVTASAAPMDQLAQGINHLADQVGLQALPQLLQQAALLAERHLVGAALARSQGRPQEAAALLGIPMPALQARMQHLGLAGAGPGTVTAESPTPQHPGPTI